jgi:hypothetical protein
MRPSGSSIAMAGLSPLSSAFSSAGTTGGRSLHVMLSRFIKSSSFMRAFWLAMPLRTSHAVWYQRRMISCFEASQHAASSQRQYPAIFTPMSVGLLYGLSPRMRVNIALSTGKISTSRL